MARFEDAIGYVLENEGVDSNDAADRGGRTRYGITEKTASAHGLDVNILSLDQALTIYRARYWNFDVVRDQRVATKMLDVVVNLGVSGGMKVIQKALGVLQDGVFGPKTQNAIASLPADEAIERISTALADRYVDICVSDHSQWVFLKGWIRRAIRRPKGSHRINV
jgi:lysozyme family protein